VDEQRDGAIGRARQGPHFYARCAREAWRRSWDAANAIPPVLGLLVLYGGARLGGLDLSFSVPGAGEYGALIGTGLFIALAWLAVFLVQFVLAPPRLHARLEAELLALARRRALPSGRAAVLPAPALMSGPGAFGSAQARGPRSDEHEAPAATPLLALPAPVREEAPVVVPLTPPARVTAPPPPMTGEELPVVAREREPREKRPREGLQIRLHDQVYETAVDTTGARLPASRAYMARIANRGDKRVRRCQLFFVNPTHVQVVSGPFDLGPGEHCDLPVLRVIDQADEPHALLYFLDGETWAVADGQAAWLPEPGRFKVKVLSANAPEAALDVALACSTSTPLAWTLVEAADVDREREAAPKAGRKRSAWAGGGVAVEPSAGD
jgi:hypothetical protein